MRIEHNKHKHKHKTSQQFHLDLCIKMSSLSQYMPSVVTIEPLSDTTSNVTCIYDNDQDDDLMPWERDGWRPLEKSGKQKTPNKIRGELQRYIDACKAGKTLCRVSCLTFGIWHAVSHYSVSAITCRWDDDANQNHRKNGS